MSYCQQCSPAGPLYICYEDMQIGAMLSANTLYYIYFKNLANDRVDKLTGVTDSGSTLTLEYDDLFDFAENTEYEFWVNQTDDETNREDFIIGRDENKCFNTKFMRGTKPVTPISTLSRGLYINGFDDILGNNLPELLMKNFFINKGINQPIFYLSNLLDSTSGRTAMRSLNTTLNNFGITKRAANVTKSVNAINLADPGTPAAYNAGCSTAAEKFTVFTNEVEWWKSNPYFASFDLFAADNENIYNFTVANNIENNAYFARCKDVAGVRSPEYIADWLVARHENLLLVDYVSTEKFNTYKGLSDGIKTQLQLIGDAAKRANKIQKMQILFASEGNNGDNMYTYYVANRNLINSFTTFKTAYDAWSYSNKSNINMVGQTIYAYDSIKSL